MHFARRHWHKQRNESTGIQDAAGKRGRGMRHKEERETDLLSTSPERVEVFEHDGFPCGHPLLLGITRDHIICLYDHGCVHQITLSPVNRAVPAVGNDSDHAMDKARHLIHSPNAARGSTTIMKYIVQLLH